MATNGIPAALRQVYKKMRCLRSFAFPQCKPDCTIPPMEGDKTLKTKPAVCRVVKAPVIPLGYQLYVSSLRVDSPYTRRVAAQAFAQCSELSIELEAGSAHPYSNAALKVIGVSRFKRVLLGFVPQGITAQLAENGLRNHVCAQLEYISQGSDGTIAIIVQVILPDTVSQLRACELPAVLSTA
jgi:hypothetical protein